MSKRSIVWGTCWLYEERETLCSFMKSAINILSKIGLEVYTVVFDAKYKRDEREIKKVEEDIECIVISNMCEIFPNKNYGVAVISKIAYKLGTDYIAVVDSDWKVRDFGFFINNMLYPILAENQDIVIPDISIAAGRCNILIGRPILNMFYPEYADKVPTAFPGAFIGITEKVCEITLKDTYHFDWGGEWDIVAQSCNMNMKIASPMLDVQNVRHRSNHSKIYDSFQIWRACMQNLTKERFELSKKLQENVILDSSFVETMMSIEVSASKQIEKLIDMSKHTKLSKTQLQLIYMVLLPLAGIMDNEYDYESLVDLETDITQPYERTELHKIALIVPHCVQAAIDCSGKSFGMIKKNAANCCGERWSRWNQLEKAKAMKLADYQIKGKVS